MEVAAEEEWEELAELHRRLCLWMANPKAVAHRSMGVVIAEGPTKVEEKALVVVDVRRRICRAMEGCTLMQICFRS